MCNLAWNIPGHIVYDSGTTNLKDHVRTMFCHEMVMFCPILRERTTGYPQQCEIWHGSSLGPLIEIQEEPILRTMLGPCLGHKRAMFWPFLGKGAMGYTHKCEIWHGTSLGTLIKIQEDPI